MSGVLLAQVEWMRLDNSAARRGHPSREQEVLHFQWFADLGNPDAQRRVGQLLSQGGTHDPQQALRYFLYVPRLSPHQRVNVSQLLERSHLTRLAALSPTYD
jgi:hypothetical protein